MMFGDVDQDSIQFQSTWKAEVKTADKCIATKPRRRRNYATQTKAMVTIGTQTEDRQPEGKIPDTLPTDEKLEDFLRRVGQMMESELKSVSGSKAFDDYRVVWNEERDTITKLHTLINVNNMQPSSRKAAKACSGVAWSCNGSILAASYGERRHVGWCEHESTVACWSIMSRRLNSTRPDIHLSVPCCVGCLAFHPSKPTILAAGLFTGEIRVWDIGGDDTEENEGEMLQATSSVDDLFHREPITSIKWVPDARGRHMLASTGGDGLVLFWRMEDKLKYPVAGSSIPPTSQYHGHGDQRNKFKVLGVTALSFSNLDYVNYIVATECGGILRCERKLRSSRQQAYKENAISWSDDVHQLLRVLPPQSRYEVKSCMRKYATKTGVKKVDLGELYASRPEPIHLFPPAPKQAFEKHMGPVYGLSASPFHRNLFLTCSTDASLRLYNILRHPRPIILMEPAPAHLYDVQWSTVRPLVFAVADATGKIHIYDLGVESLEPVL